MAWVGLENEFLVYNRTTETRISMSTIWDDLWASYSYPAYPFYTGGRGSRGILVASGTVIYPDGPAAEVVIPPVKVERGFTRTAYDLLYGARQQALRFINGSGLALSGFTTHWSLSNEAVRSSQQTLMRDFTVPLSLFCLNPLSIGIKLRHKRNKNIYWNNLPGGRFELLSEYIESKEHVRAALLMYSGLLLSHKDVAFQHPFTLDVAPVHSNTVGERYRNLVVNGRSSIIPVQTRDGRMVEITAQEYLEQFYIAYKPSLEELAAPGEMKVLDDFIQGRRSLEVDFQEHYAALAPHKHPTESKTVGVFDFLPQIMLDPAKYARKREVTTDLSWLYSYIAEPGIGFTSEVQHLSPNWVSFNFTDDLDETYSIEGIDTIELLAHILRSSKMRSSRSYAHTFYQMANLSRAFNMRELGGALEHLVGVVAGDESPDPALMNNLQSARVITKKGTYTRFGERVRDSYAALHPPAAPLGVSMPLSSVRRSTRISSNVAATI